MDARACEDLPATKKGAIGAAVHSVSYSVQMLRSLELPRGAKGNVPMGAGNFLPSNDIFGGDFMWRSFCGGRCNG